MSKGRNKELIKKRNAALCRRYYYWTEKKRLRFDDTIRLLSETEFFISEETIIAIVRKQSRESDLIKSIPKTRYPKLTARQLNLFIED
jgi:hypothetical protein